MYEVIRTTDMMDRGTYIRGSTITSSYAYMYFVQVPAYCIYVLYCTYMAILILVVY